MNDLQSVISVAANIAFFLTIVVLAGAVRHYARALAKADISWAIAKVDLAAESKACDEYVAKWQAAIVDRDAAVVEKDKAVASAIEACRSQSEAENETFLLRRKVDEYRAVIETIILERDKWHRMYVSDAEGHGNAQHERRP